MLVDGATVRGVNVPGGALLRENGTLTRETPPATLAEHLAYLLDRQLAGNSTLRVEEYRSQAVFLRALAGALRGMREAAVAKKSGKGGGR